MKKYAVLILSLVFTAQAAYAEEVGFFGRLRQKLEQITPQKKLSSTTAVGGVRGAPVEANDVYWKGEAKPVDPSELTAFQKALSLVDAGKKDEAKSAFSEFAKSYPDSPLRGDADEAVKALQQ